MLSSPPENLFIKLFTFLKIIINNMTFREKNLNNTEMWL